MKNWTLVEKYTNSNLEVERSGHGFYSGLPSTRRQHDSIWVIVYRMTKSTHFIPIKVSLSANDYSNLYTGGIVRLHGVLLSIISDRGTQFTSYFFWKSFQKGLGT